MGHKGKEKAPEEVPTPTSQEEEAGPSGLDKSRAELGNSSAAVTLNMEPAEPTTQEIASDLDLSLVIELPVDMDPLQIQIPCSSPQVCIEPQGDQSLPSLLDAETIQEDEGTSLWKTRD